MQETNRKTVKLVSKLNKKKKKKKKENEKSSKWPFLSLIKTG